MNLKGNSTGPILTTKFTHMNLTTSRADVVGTGADEEPPSIGCRLLLVINSVDSTPMCLLRARSLWYVDEQMGHEKKD